MEVRDDLLLSYIDSGLFLSIVFEPRWHGACLVVDLETLIITMIVKDELEAKVFP